LAPAPCPASEDKEHWIDLYVVLWLMKGPQYAKIAADAGRSLDTNKDTTAYYGLWDIVGLVRDYATMSALPEDKAVEYVLRHSQIGMQQALHALRDNPLDPDTLATFRNYIRDEVDQQDPQKPKDREAVQAVLIGWYGHYLQDGFPGIHPPSSEGLGHFAKGKVPDISFYDPDTASAALNGMFREILNYFREADPKEATAIEQRLADQLGPDWDTRIADVLNRVALGVAAGYDAERLFKLWDITPMTPGEFDRAVQNVQKVMDNALTGPRADTFYFKDKPDPKIGMDDLAYYRVRDGKVSIFDAPGTPG
jgi:hypothetical protein